jgi:hypothetical protein
VISELPVNLSIDGFAVVTLSKSGRSNEPCMVGLAGDPLHRYVEVKGEEEEREREREGERAQNKSRHLCRFGTGAGLTGFSRSCYQLYSP